jgi:hypothetical protein
LAVSNSDSTGGEAAGPIFRAETGWSVALGILIAFALQFLQILVLFVSPIALVAVGVTQLVYIIPSVIAARRTGRPKLGMGLIIGAAIVFSLNATCDGLLFLPFR